MKEYDARLRLIGQLNIVFDRLATLEDELLHLPLGDMYLGEAVQDAIGNLSVQAGALMATLNQYVDAAKRT